MEFDPTEGAFEIRAWNTGPNVQIVLTCKGCSRVFWGWIGEGGWGTAPLREAMEQAQNHIPRCPVLGPLPGVML